MSDVVHRAVEAAVRATPELGRLCGKRLLLTGGTGFIGTWLLESIAYLNDQGNEPCRVYVTTRDPQAFARKAPQLALRPEFTFVPGDVRALVAPVQRCEYVIHAAASASPLTKAASPVEVGETIVEGTRRVLAMAQQWHVERMLYFSSGAVYGVQPPELKRIPEDFNGGPDLSAAYSAYAEGKRFGEVLCVAHRQAHGLPVAIARPFAFVAPYQDLDSGFASTDFIRDAVRGAPIQIKRDGTTVRSYAGPSDMLRMLWGLLFRGAPGRAYNVGSDEPVSVLDLARIVAQIIGRPGDIRIAEQPLPGRLPARYVPDISRMQSDLGIRPAEPLDTVVRDTLAWAQIVISPTHDGSVPLGVPEGTRR
jgi:nucleoside-diphosphate-sugar epimerase